MQRIEKDTNKRSRLEKISRDLLTPIVRKAIKRSDFIISEWNHAVVKGDWTTSTRLVCRIFGKAKSQEREIPWSIFLKVPKSTDLAWDPWHREPFQREVLLFQSSILDSLPGGIAAPRFLGAMMHADDEPWMWLEDVQGISSVDWPVERFEKTAYQFGRMQGAFLAGAFLPDYPWLDTSSWTKPSLTQTAGWMPEILERFKNHPLTASLWDAEFGQHLRRLWLDHEDIFEALDRMPQSLCHGDFCYPNLIARHSPSGEDETVVLDWQYAGIRQIGGDIASLIGDCSITPHPRKAAEPEEFVDMTLKGYLLGLEESGWKGELRVAEFACLAWLAWPWSFNLAHKLKGILQKPLSESNRLEMERELDEYMRVQEFLFRLADESRLLLDVVG